MFESRYQEFLELTYKRGMSHADKKVVPAEQHMTLRTDIIRGIDRALAVSESVYFTELEKQNILRKCKKAYHSYCSFMKGNPDAGTSQLEDRKNALIRLIISIEIQCINRYGRNLGEEEYLDLEEIFSKHKYISVLMQEPISVVLDKAAADNSIRAIKKYKTYFMTRMGAKYHDKDCPCCQGKILCAWSEYDLLVEGIKPCRCISKAKKQATYIGLKKELEASYITAFVDESRRANPAHQIDERLDESHNIISLIMCRGKLRREADICPENTIGQYSYITESTQKLEKTTFEAIGAVMLKAGIMGLDKKLIIYSDNQGACSKWRTCKPLDLLSRGFPSVNVHFIKRGKNTMADGLIRQNEILQLPIDQMNDIIRTYSERA